MPQVETGRPSPTSRLTTKGQVTIPASIRRLLGVQAHDTVAFRVADGEVRIEPVKSVAARTAGMFSGGRRLSLEEEREAAEQAWADETDPRD